MNPALWVAKTGLDAQQMRLATISNNLANVSTTGYKRGRAVFQDLMYQNLRTPGGQTSQDTILPTGLQMGTGVRIVASEKLHTQGNVIKSDNVLDVAIDGSGFIPILLPDGTEAYTRDGGFQTDDQGQVVTSSGYTVQPGITIPQGSRSVTIGTDGTVTAVPSGANSPTTIGNLQLSSFINPAGLQSIGNNLYLESGASGTATTGTPGLNGLGRLLQGSLESSNVNVVEELVDMIETQRAYEMNSKAISTADGMLQFLNNTI